MPVDFLSDEQAARYGRYNLEPDEAQLFRYFHLDDEDKRCIEIHRGEHNRLGFALQLCTARFLGTFLEDPTAVPVGIVRYVATQIGISNLDCLDRYRVPATRYLHTEEIREHYGYRDFSAAGLRLTRWLYERAWMAYERPSVLFDLTTAWLAERKILLPGVTTLTRLIARVRDRVSARLWQRLAKLVTPEQQEKLEALLVVPNGVRISPLERLRNGPTRISAPALLDALQRVQAIRDLGVSNLSLKDIPPGRIKMLARQVAVRWAGHVARMPDEQRVARLLCFARHYEVVALDEALDLLDALVTQLHNQARATGRKQRMRTIRDLDAAALQLRHACEALVDETCDVSQVRSQAFARIPREQLQQAMQTVEALTRPPDDQFYQELTERYQTVRRFLPMLLETVPFVSTQAGKPLLEAIAFLKASSAKQKPDMKAAPMEIVSPAWKRRILRVGKEADWRAYTLCVLEQLQDALRRRDVFVSNSERWGDPRAKLLLGNEWEAARPSICRVLSREADPQPEIRRLTDALDAAYRTTAANLPQNTAVQLDPGGGFTLSPLDKLPVPASLERLRQQVTQLLPRVDLPEILLEMNVRTGFASEFTHLSESGARTADLSVSLCAVLLSQACNIGLEPLVRKEHPALSRDRLEWVQQNFLRAETLTRANALLVEAQSRIGLTRIWGGGEIASADGLRFVVPVRTLHAGPNRKYFNAERGITYYNFTSNQFSGLHGIVIAGTTHEGPFILEGILEQQTLLRPLEVMADTAAYSDLLFGLFWLLGYQFSPRLADVGEARLWRIDPAADYGALNGLARQQVNTDLITRNWDDLLRVAGSLKMNTISASELIRSLLRGKRPSVLTRAIAELGRIPKTLYLLRYMDDEAYRRRILLQLNRHEGRHSLAREVAHGRRGELRQRYREGQEDQLGALGLVVNVIVLWNTLYMDVALSHLHAQGVIVKDEDVARLSPLGWEHINLLGRYSFALSEFILRGELRPLLLSSNREPY